MAVGTINKIGQYVPLAENLLPIYSVKEYPLGTARVDEEIQIPGDAMSCWTNGTLIGCSIKMDFVTEDPIPLDKFNPLQFPHGWQRFYLTTSAQAGKTLYVFIGRAAGALTPTMVNTETTTSAGREVFYTIKTDKDSHFTGSIAQYAKEDESLVGLITNKIDITGIAIYSDQNIKYKVLFFSKDTFDDSDLDLESYNAQVNLNLPVDGFLFGSTYYMDVNGLEIQYEDEDVTNELHLSLYNCGGLGKTAGANGEVVIKVTYSPRT